LHVGFHAAFNILWFLCSSTSFAACNKESACRSDLNFEGFSIDLDLKFGWDLRGPRTVLWWFVLKPEFFFLRE
jgi:hypothetical protein